MITLIKFCLSDSFQRGLFKTQIDISYTLYIVWVMLTCSSSGIWGSLSSSFFGFNISAYLLLTWCPHLTLICLTQKSIIVQSDLQFLHNSNSSMWWKIFLSPRRFLPFQTNQNYKVLCLFKLHWKSIKIWWFIQSLWFQSSLLHLRIQLLFHHL